MPRPQRRYHKKNEPVDGRMECTHPLYTVWANMLTRCYHDKDAGYANYGGRGVSVCERWWHFKNFAADMGPKPTPKHSMDRLDNHGNYEPSNCAWRTRSQQNLNRRKFKSNTSGHAGVVEIEGRYEARLDFEGIRYRLGRFDNAEDAAAVRFAAFVDMKNGISPAAPAETIWCTSSTGIRGVTPHKDGGFIARKTVAGQRIYLGYFKTLQGAIDAINN